MKLATIRDGTIDGALVVVSSDLHRAAICSRIAPNLLTALQRWDTVMPQLRELAGRLDAGTIAAIPFNPRTAAAPLPRAPQLLDGSAFKSHGDLMGKAFGTTLPADVYTEAPLMYQGTSDDLLGAADDIVLPSEADGIDFEAEFIIVTTAVAMGVSVAQAQACIVLVGLMNDVSLRNVAPAEIATGFGFIQAKPRSSFSPVFVTLDELGPAWHHGRIELPVHVAWNEQPFGRPNAGEMSFSFGQLVAHAARRRTLSAGAIVGSGTISNDDYASVGSACIAERRMIDKVEFGAVRTPFMRFGDRVRMEAFTADGTSLCGAIDQRIVALGGL